MIPGALCSKQQKQQTASEFSETMKPASLSLGRIYRIFNSVSECCRDQKVESGEVGCVLQSGPFNAHPQLLN